MITARQLRANAEARSAMLTISQFKAFDVLQAAMM
jgi:hypothetical protein